MINLDIFLGFDDDVTSVYLKKTNKCKALCFESFPEDFCGTFFFDTFCFHLAQTNS